MYYAHIYNSPLGPLTGVSDGINLLGLWLQGQKYFAANVRIAELQYGVQLPIFRAVDSWLASYFAGQNPAIDSLALAPQGSEFRRIVWRLLCEIPYGQVTTYGELAQKAAVILHKPRMSAQAIGGAVGHNPLSIIIPCHRVIGADGSLTGYAGGLDKKILLLKTEGVNIGHYDKGYQKMQELNK